MSQDLHLTVSGDITLNISPLKISSPPFEPNDTGIKSVLDVLTLPTSTKSRRSSSVISYTDGINNDALISPSHPSHPARISINNNPILNSSTKNSPKISNNIIVTSQKEEDSKSVLSSGSRNSFISGYSALSALTSISHLSIKKQKELEMNKLKDVNIEKRNSIVNDKIDNLLTMNLKIIYEIYYISSSVSNVSVPLLLEVFNIFEKYLKDFICVPDTHVNNFEYVLQKLFTLSKETADFLTEMKDYGYFTSLWKVSSTDSKFADLIDRFKQLNIEYISLFDLLLNISAYEFLCRVLLRYLYILERPGDAFELFSVGVNKNSTPAKYGLGLCYFHGIGVNKDGKRAFDLFTAASRENHFIARYMVGECFYAGTGTGQKYSSAAGFFKSSSEAGVPEATYMYGECFYLGLGVEKNYASAATCFEISSASNEPKATYRLGCCYYYGAGVERDLSKAFLYFQMASNLFVWDATFMLGKCYYNGDGVDRDYQKAFKLFEKAYDKGIIGAGYMLGLCYYYEFGIFKNYTKAYNLFLSCSTSGNAASTFMSGWCYYFGHGIGQNKIKGRELMQKGEDLGFEPPKEMKKLFSEKETKKSLI